MTRVDKAIMEIAAVFSGERRDDKVTPAVVHAFGTMRNLTTLAGESDEDMICAALLHDVIEDFGYDPVTLEEDYGPRVRSLVEALTLPPNLSYVEKTAHLVNLMATAPLDVVLLKLCDRLDNVSDMGGWKEARVRKYVRQTKMMLAVVSERMEGSVGGSINFLVFKIGQKLAHYEQSMGAC